MEADHKAAAHVAAIWRETYPAGSTQSNMGAAYQEVLATLDSAQLHLANLLMLPQPLVPAIEHAIAEARALLTAAGWK